MIRNKTTLCHIPPSNPKGKAAHTEIDNKVMKDTQSQPNKQIFPKQVVILLPLYWQEIFIILKNSQS